MSWVAWLPLMPAARAPLGYVYTQASVEEPFVPLTAEGAVRLAVTPAFEEGGEPLTITLQPDATYGSVHANFTVPPTARAQNYDV